MNRDRVLSIAPLGLPWETFDPFLLAGEDGWRMHHGRTVPGFRRTRIAASRP